MRRAERFLGPEDDWVEDDRRIAYEAAQRLSGGAYDFVMTAKEDNYLTTVDAPPDIVEQALMPFYQRNLLSARKYREHHDGGRQWAVGSFVHDPVTTDWQHHIVLFPTKDGRTDIYAHTEVSVREGLEHLYGPVEPGDPFYTLDLLSERGLAYEQRNI